MGGSDVKMVRGCSPDLLDPQQNLPTRNPLTKKAFQKMSLTEKKKLSRTLYPKQAYSHEPITQLPKFGFRDWKLSNPSWAITSSEGCLEWDNPKARGLAYAETVGGGVLLAGPFALYAAKAPGWYKIPSFIVVGLVYSVGSFFGYEVAANKHTWCAGQEPPGPIAIYASLFSDVSSWL